LSGAASAASGIGGERPPRLNSAFADAALRLVDSITEAAQFPPGAVLVSGSHGGASVVRYALEARPRMVVFNDAGVGLEQAGIAALAALQRADIAACTVAHDSARIGEAVSTLATGVISFCNDGAAALGGRPGRPLREWLVSAA
jgi:hypothetical protein